MSEELLSMQQTFQVNRVTEERTRAERQQGKETFKSGCHTGKHEDSL